MLMDIERSKDRVCVNIPPRHGKSQLAPYSIRQVPGAEPYKKVMMVSHTTTQPGLDVKFVT